MSVYKKARRHAVLTLLVFFGFIPWMLVATSIVPFEWAPWPYMILYLGMGVWSMGFVCPTCGSRLFMRGMWSFPWPNAICSKCGESLREVPQ
ncbi:MAG: hypothetical protein CL808_08575 [Citromicrobium sp.]|nr:hypothetical protein [Citromicrobium sp.]